MPQDESNTLKCIYTRFVEKQINMSKIDTYYLEEVSVLEEISKME
jgi:hypothetical protein